MNIDKILFACSEIYASFWPIQARVWKECLDIEPVCLFFGDKQNMSEEHGQVIEMAYMDHLPKVLQVVWSKFDYPTREPDTTWLIGDIDLIPLQRAHFIDKLALFPSWVYAHLNAEGINKEYGGDFPAHYHASKGQNFEIFTQGRTFEDQIKHIVASKKYGQGARGGWGQARRDSDADVNYWLAEEHYTSELIWQAIREGMMDCRLVTYNNRHGTERIDRSHFDGTNYNWEHDWLRVFRREYVDMHCSRPFFEQEQAMNRILNMAWGKS